MAGKPRRVLVVDDELLILKTVQRALQKVGYEVTTASNREQFLAALNGGAYAVCIVDLKMKDLSLVEIKEKMKTQSVDVHFLVMSGTDYKGSESFLQKPFRIDELRKAVNALIGT